MSSALPPWRQDLRASLERNKSDPVSRYLQLATVRRDGSPANRTVVFRGFGEPADVLLMVSDTRSAKYDELRNDPRTELAWYFPKTREQYRFQGTIELHDSEGDAALREERWQALSPAAQAQYFEDFKDEAADSSMDPSQPPPWFLVLALTVTAAERLDLRPSPQQRERFIRTESGWDRQTL